VSSALSFIGGSHRRKSAACTIKLAISLVYPSGKKGGNFLVQMIAFVTPRGRGKGRLVASYEQCCGSGSTSSSHVFGPPGSGSGSTSQRYGSRSGSFYHHAKIVRKTLIPTIL
jgi:hypothetical protein